MSATIYIATRKGLFTIRKHQQWQIDKLDFTGAPVSNILKDSRDGKLYAALNHGHFGVKLHRSDDNGESWQELAAPKYPVKPEDEPDVLDSFRNIPIPWAMKQIFCLVQGGDDQPGRIWCGTIPGGLFRSDDHGASWQFDEKLWRIALDKVWTGGGFDYAGIHSICVDPRNSQHITIGVSVGGIWRSEDDGNSWTIAGEGLRNEYMPPGQEYDPYVQDPHRMVQCNSDPDRIWVQHHNGMFVSEDGAKTFREIEKAGPSTFGFAVAVHPADANTAWFVPGVKDECRIPVDGKLVVTKTTDGGEHFSVLSNGLPQQHAYDLVYRHGLAVDDTGELLVMGSTTGAVWLSEDGGDNWQLVNAHLPPVYEVHIGKNQA